jgi:hypothetical protein
MIASLLLSEDNRWVSKLEAADDPSDGADDE